MIEKINTFETSLIEKFRLHPLFIHLDALTWNDFLEILTKMIRDESYKLMGSCLGKEYCQVGLVAFLRFWAEVLVSIEYSCLWQRISEHLSSGQSHNKVRSEFYYFHMIHDSRNSDVGKESFLGGLTHSQELAIHLQELILSEEALFYCINIEKTVYQLKYQFYDQFITYLKGIK